MWVYEKKLEYPVCIKSKDLKMAQLLLTQYGGPSGELSASLQYLTQRYTMPTEQTKALLTDIGTEELAHVEIIATMVYQIMSNATPVELKAAGLDMVYMGLESGADEVLQAVKKGVTADEMIEAGKKVRAAGMILSMTVISGLGGKKLWREHALGSARVISAIKPEYVGFLTLMIEPGTEMYDQYNRGEIELLTPHEVLDETELFIRSVDAEGTMFRSNHASNYIPLGGTLNGERDKILGQIEISRRKSKFRPDVFRGI